MKRCYLFLTMFCILITSVKAQRTYDYYSLNDKQKIFREEFDNDNNLSLTIPPLFKANTITRIEDGFFIVSNAGQTSSPIYFTSYSINPDKNFELEASIAITNKNKTGGGGISVGNLDSALRYIYAPSSEQLKIYSQSDHNQTWREIVPWFNCSSINAQPSAANILTFRKIDDSCYFFMNGDLQSTIPSSNYIYKYLGLSVPGNCTIKVDYIKGSYIDGPSNYSFYTSATRKDLLNDNFTNNNNNWPMKSSSKITSRLGDGYYEVTYNDTSFTNVNLYNFEKLINEDIEIEVLCKYSWLDKIVKTIGFLAGSGIDFSSYFILKSNRDIETAVNKNGEWITVTAPKMAVFNPNALNKFTIRRVGGTYYYFINGELVCSTNILSVFNNCSMLVNSQTSLRISKLRVSLLNSTAYSSSNITETYPSPISITGQPANPATIDLKGGKFYALIIGAQNYAPSIGVLDYPLANANGLYQTLKNNYLFDSIAYIPDPKRADIEDALDFFSHKLNRRDNFLLYYAGHGCWDSVAAQGYWTPIGADKSKYYTMVSNGNIRDALARIPALHTLLISDACFAGGIFKSRDIEQAQPSVAEVVYGIKSRKAMTSGAMTKVPDRSIFSQYLIAALQNNIAKYLSAEQLFYNLKPRVIENSKNTSVVPQFGVIVDTEDQGGDFVFIRK